ncbi:hypothetical protein WA026_023815 [Henosepilachna vigintioctopunctata]|uniref:Uncharacterized protein n=1 Tax=Henosepilachna vigintioctopunctata TaxID=420089 RepID=A0AAW1UP30_9CUCU
MALTSCRSNPAYIDIHKKTKREYYIGIRKAKQKFFDTKFFFSKNRPKQVWNAVRSLIGSKSKNQPAGFSGDFEKLANDFNRHFTALPAQKINHIEAKIAKNLKCLPNSFYVFDVLESEVVNTLKAL